MNGLSLPLLIAGWGGDPVDGARSDQDLGTVARPASHRRRIFFLFRRATRKHHHDSKRIWTPPHPVRLGATASSRPLATRTIQHVPNTGARRSKRLSPRTVFELPLSFHRLRALRLRLGGASRRSCIHPLAFRRPSADEVDRLGEVRLGIEAVHARCPDKTVHRGGTFAA